MPLHHYSSSFGWCCSAASVTSDQDATEALRQHPGIAVGFTPCPYRWSGWVFRAMSADRVFMNRMTRWSSLLVVAICSLAEASAAESFTDRLGALQSGLQSDPTNTLIVFQLGELCYREGANNNKKAVILAESYFLRLLAIYPDHAMARVRYGSVLTMKARDALWPFAQLNYVKAGNREMDAAVKIAPTDAQVRFARAVNNFHMPEIMGREEIVQADLAWLWQQAQLADTQLNVGQKQTIALYYGATLQKNSKLDEGLQIWRAGLDLAPKSEDAIPLKEQIKKHNARTK